MKSRLLSLVFTLFAATHLSAQTAAESTARGKTRLGERDPLAAKAAFEAALAIDPSAEEAHLYLGLCELLLFVEGPEASAALAALGATLDLNWPQGRFDFDWIELSAVEASVAEAIRWQYTLEESAIGGDAVRSEGAPLGFEGNASAQLAIGTVQGPGEVFFRTRADVPPSGQTHFLFYTEPYLTGRADDVDLVTVGEVWNEVSLPVADGERNLIISRSIRGPSNAVEPTLWVDAVYFIPDDADAPAANDPIETGATLANGIDNGNLPVTARIEADSSRAEASFVDPAYHTAGTLDFIAGPLSDQLNATLAHLAEIDSEGFRSEFVFDLGQDRAIEVDLGDIQILRSTLEGLVALLQLLTSTNGETEFALFLDLIEVGALDSMQSIMTLYPDLLKTARPANRAAAEAALRRAQALYLAGSERIRARPAGIRRLFNLDARDEADEEALREELARVIAAIETPTAVDEPLLASGSFPVVLGALFDPTTDWRALLPVFTGNRAVSQTAPDPTLNGLFPEAEAVWADEALQALDLLAAQPSTVATGATPVPGRLSEQVSDPADFLILATDETATLLIILIEEAGERSFHLWDRNAETFTRFDRDADGRPLENVQSATISGDGETLFLTAADAILAGRQPGAEITVNISDPVFFSPYPLINEWVTDERIISVSDVVQPNGATGPSYFLVTADILAEVEKSIIWCQMTLEDPTGEHILDSNFFFEAGDVSTDIPFRIPPSPSKDLEGDWKLRLSYADVAGNEPAIQIRESRFVFDTCPATILRRTVGEPNWTVLTRNASGELANGSTISWLVSDRSGDRISFVSSADNHVSQTVDRDPAAQAYILDVPSGKILLLSATPETGFDLRARETSISASGDRVVFYTEAVLIESDINQREDVYVYQYSNDSLRVASTSTSGLAMPAGNWDRANDCHISSNGRYVTFRSNSSTLANDEESMLRGRTTLFVKDLETDRLVSLPHETPLFAPTASADGRFLYAVHQDLELNHFDLWVFDVETTQGYIALSGQKWPNPVIAPLAQLTAISDYQGNSFFHDPETGSLESFHLLEGPASYVAMESPGLVLEGTQTSLQIPVTLYPGADAEVGEVVVSFRTTGYSALPVWHYRDDALPTLTLTAEAPTEALTIPIHSQAFGMDLGVLTVQIESIDGPAQRGYPDSTVVVLDAIADPDLYAAWLLTAFADIDERENPAISGPFVDSDRDGRPNLVEFALGSDPQLPDAAMPLVVIPVPPGGHDALEFTYNENAGLHFAIEVSDDLRRWDTYPLRDFPILQSDDLGAGRKRFVLEWPNAVRGERYYRLRIEPAP